MLLSGSNQLACATLTYEEMMSLLAINYGLESKTVSILRILQIEEFYSSLKCSPIIIIFSSNTHTHMLS